MRSLLTKVPLVDSRSCKYDVVALAFEPAVATRDSASGSTTSAGALRPTVNGSRCSGTWRGGAFSACTSNRCAGVSAFARGGSAGERNVSVRSVKSSSSVPATAIPPSPTRACYSGRPRWLRQAPALLRRCGCRGNGKLDSCMVCIRSPAASAFSACDTWLTAGLSLGLLVWPIGTEPIEQPGLRHLQRLLRLAGAARLQRILRRAQVVHGIGIRTDRRSRQVRCDHRARVVLRRCCWHGCPGAATCRCRCRCRDARRSPGWRLAERPVASPERRSERARVRQPSQPER